MDVVRWIAGSVCMLFFLAVCVSHLAMLLRWIREGVRFSCVPFVGGVAGAIGILMLPVAGLRWSFWLPLVIDIGAVPLALAVAGDRLRRIIRRREGRKP